mmetsp:Transcript_22214/g.46536  ORF Transcript_22214/g.46536 Transcript_22214/m.46536 type:complete len:183 (+) Transcript_22214:88-636(+)
MISVSSAKLALLVSTVIFIQCNNFVSAFTPHFPRDINNNPSVAKFASAFAGNSEKRRLRSTSIHQKWKPSPTCRHSMRMDDVSLLATLDYSDTAITAIDNSLIISFLNQLNESLLKMDQDSAETLAGPFFGLSLFPYLAFLFFSPSSPKQYAERGDRGICNLSIIRISYDSCRDCSKNLVRC